MCRDMLPHTQARVCWFLEVPALTTQVFQQSCHTFSSIQRPDSCRKGQPGFGLSFLTPGSGAGQLPDQGRQSFFFQQPFLLQSM